MQKFFYQISADEAIKRLETDGEKGLSEVEAARRLKEYGPNKLQEGHKRPIISHFFDQFKDLLIVVLIVAAMLAYYLDDFRGGTILLVIVFVNACIGFYQEYKAEKILEALKKIVVTKATVIRDGKKREVQEWELVPGDLVYLEEGSAVPADIRLTQTTNFSTNDFILTGESVPQEKRANLVIKNETTLTNQDNLVFLGISVAIGNAYGVVYGTGSETAIGRIAQTTENIHHDVSPLQKEINSLAKTLTKIAGFIALSLFFINFALQANQTENLKNLINVSILFAIGVAAACVPQGLPAQVSVALSLGVGRLAEKKAVVKKLSSVETLGSTTVICSDKTGTITKNEMTITHCYVDGREFEITGEGYAPTGTIVELFPTGKKRKMSAKDLEPIKQFFEDGFLASDGRIHKADAGHKGWYAIGDPTEAAFTPLLIKAFLKPEIIGKRFAVAAKLPFDSDRKRMTIIHTHKGKTIGYMKGSLESVLDACNHINHAGKVMRLTQKEKKEILKYGEKFANQALRVIALAYRDFPKTTKKYSIKTTERDFIFSGFVAMIDPPKAGVKEAVKAAYDAHIRLMMITGDNAVTARAIAERIGMIKTGDPAETLTGDDVKVLTDVKLKRLLTKQVVIFSRVSPEDKYHIVNTLKQMGDVVAVTGDGVNDTLSLKRSDIGVAMGRMGSQVAQEAGDMILVDDNFRTIVSAIREGRLIFQNLKKTILASITSNNGELACVLLGFIGVAYGLPAPITAVQILAIDLIGEMLPLTALTFDKADRQLMESKPRNLNDHIVNKRSIIDLIFYGFWMGASGFFSFYMVYRSTGNLAMAQAAAYSGIIVCQWINILSRRTQRTIFTNYLFTNTKLWGALLISVTFVLIMIYTPAVNIWFNFEPMRLTDWVYPLMGGAVFLFWHEAKKLAVKLKRI